MQESNESYNDLRTTIEPGDLVRWVKENGYTWMTEEEVNGDYALCTYSVLDPPLDGCERPTAFVPKQRHFPLNELQIQKGH